MSELKCRAYVFTQHEESPETFLQYQSKWPGAVKYCIWQLEKAPTTGKLHLQGYIELTSPQRLSAVKKLLGNSVHLEKRMGTRDQAREYCQKAETKVDGPWEWGEWGAGQGARNDLKALAETVKTEGITGVVQKMPEMYIKYHSGTEKLFNRLQALENTKFRKIEVHILYGPPGTGKTRYVFEKEPSLYFKRDEKWWDGYDGQEAILIDDYYGNHPVTSQECLHLLDGYPIQGQIKGGHVQLTYKRVYFTSNQSPEEWRDTGGLWLTDAIRRRITTITYVQKSEPRDDRDMGQSGVGNTNHPTGQGT